MILIKTINYIITRIKFILIVYSVIGSTGVSSPQSLNQGLPIICGAERLDEYLSILLGKKVALIVNQTSRCGKRHLLDTLISLSVNVVKVFGPEHGFRGDIPAGKYVKDYKDPTTGIEVISLYGEKKKPSAKDLENVDILIFDIQDVGARFFTYISTMALCMEACAESGKKFIVLDRPNPNGFYIDGPVLEPSCSSFVGMHPVPIVHGMTVGEYAKMLNGEKWLTKNLTCDLTVIPCLNYSHKTRYIAPIPPSPNLNTPEAIYLYPSLCLFEGTIMSVGRGTQRPFTMVGHPQFKIGSFSFTPVPIEGMSDNPKFKGQKCYGYDLSQYALNILRENGRIELFWIIDSHNQFKDLNFFNDYFDKLAGNKTLRQQILSGKSEDDIRKSWENDLKKFKDIRKRYIIYEDFY